MHLRTWRRRAAADDTSSRGASRSLALKEAEPQFFEIWKAVVTPEDPQFERWAVLESEQLEIGRKRVAEIQRHVPLQGKDVLDVGCQWGATCIPIAEAGAKSVTGLDVEEKLMEGARVRAREQGVEATFVHGFAEALPFPDASFDAVVCVNVLEHVRDHEQTIRELLRVLRPGGRLHLDGPNRLSPWWFARDPHYQLVGISVLPPALGERYVTRVRKFPSYDVGVFPIAQVIERRLKANGARIVWRSLDSGRPKTLGRVAANAKSALWPMFVFVVEKPLDS